MANIKISDLTAAAAATGTQEFEVNDSLTSKKVTGAQVLSYVQANTTPASIGAVSTSDTIAVAKGGTGATTAANARTNLGLVIGTDVLAPNGSGASLTSLNASNLSSGTVSTARLATSGTADSTTFLRGDGTWATAGGTPTTDQVLTATAGASVGAVGTYALLGETSITSTGPGNTRAGSSLRYAGFGRSNNGWTSGEFRGVFVQGGSSAPSGTWRAMGYAASRGANDPYDPAVYGATLWLRIS